MKMQDLVRFNYCPRCGSQDLAPKESKAIACNTCGFQYFHNPAPAVAGIIEKEDCLLLIKRGRDPQKGFLNFPGGFVDYAESLEEGLAREMREELNLVVTRQHYLTSDWETYLYREVLYPTAVTFFMIEVEDISKARAGDDAEGFSFVPVEAVDAAQLAFKSSRTAIQIYREWRKHANLQ
jgi:ADP-ribose pyrophosphatase YjhB (NUDIX family)